jgi:hypothetical protein
MATTKIVLRLVLAYESGGRQVRCRLLGRRAERFDVVVYSQCPRRARSAGEDYAFILSRLLQSNSTP